MELRGETGQAWQCMPPRAAGAQRADVRNTVTKKYNLHIIIYTFKKAIIIFFEIFPARMLLLQLPANPVHLLRWMACLGRPWLGPRRRNNHGCGTIKPPQPELPLTGDRPCLPPGNKRCRRRWSLLLFAKPHPGSMALTSSASWHIPAPGKDVENHRQERTDCHW